MEIVIVEDEIIAAQTLQRLICEIRNDFRIVTVLQSVEESVEWFNTHQTPDLIFMDIHLADGSSFSIFQKCQIDCPVIFTTAYNEYALEAFESNGIDYLLKPIGKTRLAKAITKFDTMSSRSNNNELVSRLFKMLNENQQTKKSHFLVPYKDKLIPLAVNDIAYFYAEMKVAKAVTFNGSSYLIDHSLDELMRIINPEHFFRVNRQYIVSHKAIKDLSVWFMGKLSVNLSIPITTKIFVSKGRAQKFKAWYTKDF